MTGLKFNLGFGCWFVTGGGDVSGRRVTASQFTAIWLVLGTGLNFVLVGNLPLYHEILRQFGISAFTPTQTSALLFTDDLSIKYLPFQTVLASTGFAAIGLGLLFLSSRLDFVDRDDDPIKNPFVGSILGLLAVFFAISWLCFLGIELERYGQSTHNSFILIFAMIPMLILSFPALFVSSMYVFCCTSLWLAGIVTVPRSVHAYVRRHQLTQAWTRGKRAQRFDSAAVIASFGDRTTSGAEGRKLRKDADRLRDQVEMHVVGLRSVRDRLKSNVLNNEGAEAMRREADDILAKLASLTAKEQASQRSSRQEGR